MWGRSPLSLARLGRGGAGFVAPVPLAISDFKNDVHSIGGVSKTFAEMWEDGATFWPGYGYPNATVTPGVGFTLTGDAATIVEGGGTNYNTYLAVLPALWDALDPQGGFSFVMDYSVTKTGDVSCAALLNLDNDPNYTEAWGFSSAAYIKPAVPADQGDWGVGDQNTSSDHDFLAPGSHRAACSFEAGQLAGSVDGSVVAILSGTQNGTLLNELYLWLIIQHSYPPYTDSGTATATIEKAAFYALQDAAVLPGLSA